jgi:hypothetical protein
MTAASQYRAMRTIIRPGIQKEIRLQRRKEVNIEKGKKN